MGPWARPQAKTNAPPRRLAPTAQTRVHFNADDVRANINKDLWLLGVRSPSSTRGRMGWPVRSDGQGGMPSRSPDFNLPDTGPARQAFMRRGPSLRHLGLIASRPEAFEDTNRMFRSTRAFSICAFPPNGSPEILGPRRAMKLLAPRVRSERKPTALFLGPLPSRFHDGHRSLNRRGHQAGSGQAWLSLVAQQRRGVSDDKKPVRFRICCARARNRAMAYARLEGRFIVVPLPNITNILLWPRTSGYIRSSGLSSIAAEPRVYRQPNCGKRTFTSH